MTISYQNFSKSNIILPSNAISIYKCRVLCGKAGRPMNLRVEVSGSVDLVRWKLWAQFKVKFTMPWSITHEIKLKQPSAPLIFIECIEADPCVSNRSVCQLWICRMRKRLQCAHRDKPFWKYLQVSDEIWAFSEVHLTSKMTFVCVTIAHDRVIGAFRKGL